MVFRNMEEQSTYTLRNQEMEKMSFGEEEIEVELGIEEADGTHLYYKMCGEEECFQVFLDFFHNGLTVNLKAYQPVAF